AASTVPRTAICMAGRYPPPFPGGGPPDGRTLLRRDGLVDIGDLLRVNVPNGAQEALQSGTGVHLGPEPLGSQRRSVCWRTQGAKERHTVIRGRSQGCCCTAGGSS